MLVRFIFDDVVPTIDVLYTWPKDIPIPRAGELLNHSLFEHLPNYKDIYNALQDAKIDFLTWDKVDNTIMPILYIS